MNEEHEFNIRQIQRALRILHKNGEDIPIVFEDGIFGEETERAILAFQKQNNLPESGIVDYETWVLLMESTNEYIRKNAEPFPIFPYVSDEESSVLPEEEGKAIWFLQAMLITIGEKYSGTDGVELNGKNDEATRNAIKYIHKCEEGESCDGALTQKTWNSVARLFNAI
ncbi:MAG: peptidoglycan-binding protein [Oscillospiraceae bacterium]|nr:peptidoglycan-binding protein [Oscillospiraceae bacterium]